MDPDFRIHRAISQVMAFSVLALADNRLLPMNATNYAERLIVGVKALLGNHGEELRKYNITSGKCKDVELTTTLPASCSKDAVTSK